MLHSLPRSLGSAITGVLSLFFSLLLSPCPADEEAQRTRIGLLGLYEFQELEGADVRDSSAAGAPVDLAISDINRIRRSNGSLEITGRALLKSKRAPARFHMAIKRSSEVTLEAWIQTNRLDQTGPARIVTLSQDSSNRNLTLGQDGDALQIRHRTTKTSANGLPALSSPKGSLTRDLTHVTFTCNQSGETKLYLNGEVAAESDPGGRTGNWSTSYSLALGNEVTGGRPWYGAFHLVALYNRDLAPSEIKRHFRLGPDAPTEPPKTAPEIHPNARLFEESIAPIFARHCLECHDTANRKGKLDLSKRAAAEEGGSEGEAIVPGSAEESLLWELVKFDDMPEDRKPLLPEEKALLKQWIDGGARWNGDTIDPLAHKRDHRANENWVRRLTVSEYIETVRAALGVDIEQEARERLPQDLRADGFHNTAYNLGVDFKHIEAYSELASLIVAKLDPLAFARRFSRNLKFTDREMGALINRMGKWLLRGPLEDHEVIAYRGITTTVASGGGSLNEAVGFVIEAMLQSPRFIYQVENQRGDGNVWPVGEFEMASRMSYILWSAPPDQDLYDAAERGELYDSNAIAQMVDCMLQDPRAITQSTRFFSEWLHLDRLANLRPNRERFPDWEPALAEDMKAETLAFFKDLVWKQERPLSDLLNAPFSYLTPRLAKHYRLDQPLLGKADELQRVNFSEDATRGGLLSQGSVLTIGGDEASMVTRGLFVLHDLLRSGVKDPPPGVDTNPVPTKPGLTQRAIAEKRVANRSCGGCHSKFEPLAYGLERFDGLGSYHEADEHGNALREDGEILFPGTADPVPFETARELMDLLAGSDRVKENLTWKVTQFALGRPLVPADRPELDRIHKLALEGGFTYKSLIKAIVLSDLVRSTRTEPNGPS